MNQQISTNIWRYYLFTALSFTPVSLPVFVLFWKDNGLDLFEIFILQGIFSVAIVIFEVPAGMIADRLGKKVGLIASTVFLSISYLIYGSGHSFFVFLIGELFIALGFALISGADSALLYDSLKYLNRENEYKRIEGRARAIQLVSFAICNLIGGIVGSYSYRATVYLSAIGPIFAFLLALGFVEVYKTHSSKTLKEGVIAYKDLIGSSLKFIKKHRLVRWFIILNSVLVGSSSWLLWLYQPYMKWTGVPVWFFGVAFAIFNLIAAFMSNFAHKIENRLGQEKTLVLFMILQVSPLLLMSIIITPFSFLFILGHQTVRGLSRPIFNDWILRYTYADKRATILSLNSLGNRLFFAVTSPIIGYIANNTDYPTNFRIQAGVITIIFLIMLVSYRKIPQKYFQIKDNVAPNQ